MIIHILVVLIAALFWNKTIVVIYGGHKIIMPIVLVMVLYGASIYFIFKCFFLLKRFSGRFFDSRNKAEAAKEKAVQAMLAYAGGDIAHGHVLWQEASKYLEKDKLFALLSAVNAQFDPTIKKETKQLGGVASLMLAFFNKDAKLMESCSKIEVLDILKKYPSPWLYRELIKFNINQNEVEQAEKVLKQFWNGGYLSLSEWKELRAKIFAQEASFQDDLEQKIKFCRKANRLDKRECALELAVYHKKRREVVKARRIIEDVWPVAPSIQLGRIYMELDEFDTIPIHKFQHARELTKLNENHPISHILVATYAMESELWAIAMEYLNKFQSKYPELGYMLLARLESRKSGNSEKVWKNIEKAFVMMAKKEKLDVDSII